MSYLQDKSRKRNKSLKIAACVLVFFVLGFFRTSIFSGLSYLSGGIFRPVLNSGNSVGAKLSNIGSYLAFKSSLSRENVDLKSKIEADLADRANYNSVVQENIDLKNILGRKNEQTNMILAAILTKPNQSPYDTLVIDVGTEKVSTGNRVFALGNVPIGRVAEAGAKSSKVILFSNSGETTQVVISGKNVFAELTGRGGGNFEMTLPRDFVLLKEDQVVLPGIVPYVVGVVETIISDPRDSSQKALLVTPVDIQELKFVEIET